MASFSFYTLPMNTSGAVLIPVTNTPTPLATVTVVAGQNELVVLRANIGWIARFLGAVNVTGVLFKIWRGAPVTGELISSAQDIAESGFDNAVTTDFSEVVSGFTSSQTLTFVLTAETVSPNARVDVIGPLTFGAFVSTTDLISFFQLPNNTSGAANIPVAQTPVPVGFIVVDVQPGQSVALRSTVGWRVISRFTTKADVLFKIWRGAPVIGTLVASADDSADVEGGAVTTFSHVDTSFTTAQRVVYILTAEVPEPRNSISITGPVSFTGSREPLASFFTLPNNTADSVSIPLTTTGTPLAALTASVGPGVDVVLRAAIGWLAPQTPSDIVTPILFKIWRGAPFTGTLIYSALDTGETAFDFRKVTTLGHVDSGFTSSQTVTYTLTAELTKPGTAANVVGPLTFTVFPVILPTEDTEL